MSLTASRGELKKALTTLGRIADRKSTMPMLGGVAIKVSHEGTTITATDLNVWATYKTAPLAGNRIPGSAVVRAKSLADIVGKMPEGDVTIAGDNPHVYVMAGSANVHVDSYCARDYPKIPDTSALVWHSVDGAELARCVKQVSSSVCRDETRFHLNGVYMHCEGKSLRVIATDGHRLAYARSAYDDVWQTLFLKGMIVPAKAATEIVKLFGKGGICQMARDPENERMLHFRKGEWEMSVRTIDALFPPYEQVVPKTSTHAVTVDIVSLRGVCERAIVVSGKYRPGMTLERFNDSPMLRLTCGNDERIEEQITCSSGDAFKIGVDPVYLLAALEHVESRTSQATLAIGAALDPIAVFSRDEGLKVASFSTPHFTIIMPMRI